MVLFYISFGIAANLGVRFHQYLSAKTHFARMSGGVSKDSPVLSGVPQGTVLAHCYLLS